MVSLKVEAANASAHLADPKEEPGVLDTGLLSLHINVCLRARACVYMVYRLAAQRRALLRNSRIVRDLSLLLAIAFTCGGGFIRTNSDHACPFAVYIYIHVYIMCVCTYICKCVCICTWPPDQSHAADLDAAQGMLQTGDEPEFLEADSFLAAPQSGAQ
jgi:hypothetical protein